MMDPIPVKPNELPTDGWAKTFRFWPVVVAFKGKKPVRSFIYQECLIDSVVGMTEFRRPINKQELGGVKFFHSVIIDF